MQLQTRAIVKLEEKCFGMNIFALYFIGGIIYSRLFTSEIGHGNYTACVSQKLFTNCFESIQNANYFPCVWNTIQPTLKFVSQFL